MTDNSAVQSNVSVRAGVSTSSPLDGSVQLAFSFYQTVHGHKKREMVYWVTEGLVCVGVVNACIMIQELKDISFIFWLMVR